MKNLRKKISRLEKRLREGPQKLAQLERRLEVAQAVKTLKAARKSAARAAAAQIAEAKKKLAAKKAKRKLNLSPERRAQLAAAMKARWAAKRAAEASAVEPSPQPPEGGHAAVQNVVFTSPTGPLGLSDRSPF